MTMPPRPYIPLWVLSWMGLLLLASCAGHRSITSTPDERLVERFRDRVNKYMDLRRQAVDSTGPLTLTSDPATLTADRQALGAEIRRRRAGTKHGGVFTPEIRAYFRRLLAPVLEGERGEDVRFRLNDDAPGVNAVPLTVNAPYPAGLPFPTTPWPILARLPSLPVGLSYRVIGQDLILLDQPADLIVDYMRNALPGKPAA